MKSLKTLVMFGFTGVLGLTSLTLAGAPGFARSPGIQPPVPPPVAQPPATQPPPGTKPEPQAPPKPAPQPRPFPEGARIAYIDMQAIASLSAEGKAAAAKIQDWEKKVNADLTEKNKTLQASRTKLQQGSSVLSDQARVQLEKDIEKMQRDFQFAQQDAQTERTEFANQLQVEFQEKLNPVIEQVRTEKGLLMIFSARESGVVSADPGLDLSAEVVKRFDAAAKATKK